jgi:hypothetical protein
MSGVQVQHPNKQQSPSPMHPNMNYLSDASSSTSPQGLQTRNFAAATPVIEISSGDRGDVKNPTILQNRKSIQVQRFPRKDFGELPVNKGINRLIYGMAIKKTTNKGNGPFHPVVYYILEDDLSTLQWVSAKKSFIRTRINLKTVTAIAEMPTKTVGKMIDKSSQVLLCINHGKGEEMVLQFETVQEKLEWWCGLQDFVLRALNEMETTDGRTSNIAKDVFAAIDKQGDHKLDKNEMFSALKRMRIHITKQHCDELFNQTDVDKNGSIDYSEFLTLCKKLSRREELLPLYKKYCKNFQPGQEESPLMTIDELIQFYQTEQNQVVTRSAALEIVNNSKEENEAKTAGVSFLNFTSILFSKRNSAFNEAYANEYQDMRRPLPDYFISSSHNTYLTANQLTGQSSVYAYVNALRMGFRLVELDLWNGDKDEPIVYHGHTLTSKIFLRDIAKAIKEYGFETNPYPIMFSFEMHCDVKGQDKIAQILKEECGDLIYMLPPDFDQLTNLPSPAELKNKILIKGKRDIKGMESTADKVNSDGEFNEDEKHNKDQNIKAYNDNNKLYEHAINMEKGHVRTNSNKQDTEEEDKFNGVAFPKDYDKNTETYFLHNKKLQDSFKNSQKNIVEFNSSEKNSPDQDIFDDGDNSNNNLRSKPGNSPGNNHRGSYDPTNVQGDPETRSEVKTLGNIGATKQQLGGTRESLPTEHDAVTGLALSNTPGNNPKKGHKVKDSQDLMKYYALIGYKWDLRAPRLIWHVSSISENKMNSLYKSNQKELVDFHKRHLTKVYPAGLRIDSSNYNPVPSWNCGIQIVALNCQTADEPMFLNYAKFIANGANGYVLKPKFLYHETLSNASIARYPCDFTKPVKKLTVTVLGGKQLRGDNIDDNKEITPFVEVKIRGLDIDEKNNTSYKTPPCIHPFNPRWTTPERECKAEFKICGPEFCTVLFYVMNFELLNAQRLSWYAVELKNLVTGYRSIPLLDSTFQPMQNSYLLCYITLEDI